MTLRLVPARKVLVLLLAMGTTCCLEAEKNVTNSNDAKAELLVEHVERHEGRVRVSLKIVNSGKVAVYLSKTTGCDEKQAGLSCFPGLYIQQLRCQTWITVSDRVDLPATDVKRLNPGKFLAGDVVLIDFDRIIGKGVKRVVIEGKHRALVGYYASELGARHRKRNLPLAVSKVFVVAAPTATPETKSQ